MVPPSAMRSSAVSLGADAVSPTGAGGGSAGWVLNGTSGGSRIPVPPPRSIKREASESLTSVQVRESPSLQRLHRLASLDSPAKFRKPAPPEEHDEGSGSPALAASHAVRSLSLAPNCRSPLATPPGRRRSGGIGGSRGGNMSRPANEKRLSMYGVPLGMLGGTEATGRRSTSHVRGPLQSPTAAACSTLTLASLRDKRIVVCVRKRPLATAEMRGGDDCVRVSDNGATVGISVLRTKLDGIGKYHEDYAFAFDRAYGEAATNEQVYEEIVDPLVRFCAQGGRATCFAYGQTGSGKTHTMFHPRDGQCYLALTDLLRRKERGVELWISFFEIYQGQLYDLLRDRKRVIPCERKDGQVAIMGLEEDSVGDEVAAREVIQRGLAARMTGRTGANAQSSRSHAILQFTLRPRASGTSAGGGDHSSRSIPPSSPPSPASDMIYGRLSFIDLAGSERGADRADVDRRTKLEGSEINKSLLALKECIRALDLDAAHLPFRQSKLTLVLKDSIIGDVRTAMIATVSPATGSSEHSLNTLRYAERFHEISAASTLALATSAAIPSVWPHQQRSDRPPSSPAKGLAVPQRVGTEGSPSRGEDWRVLPLGGRAGGAPPTGPSAAHGVGGGKGQGRQSISTGTPRHSPPTPHRSRHITPVKTVTFAMPVAAVEDRKRQIDDLLVSLRTLVQACRDDDVLEVLQEELANISHAFRSLA